MASTHRWNPDRCPEHPHSGHVVSKTTEAFNQLPLQHTLTQHRCGEPGCSHYLGWEYNAPANTFKAGPARCTDTDILLTVTQNLHDRELEQNIFLLVLMSSMLLMAAWWPTLSITINEPWSLWHTTAATLSTILITAISTLVWHKSNANRPTPESIQATLQG